MRTMILALAVILLAAPVWAVVYITATDEGGGVVAIEYNSVGEPNLVRAFGLDITVKEGNIVDCCDYAVGDDNFGYGIFPGTFGVLTVNPDGQVETWDVNTYTPVSAGLDTNWVTIEMGSLYDLNAPGNFGTLCRVSVSSNPAYLSVTENLLNGGVVMEDANEPVGGVDLTGATDVPIDGVGCHGFPSSYSTYHDWVLLGMPECWTGHFIPEWRYQCDGDADGIDSGMPFNFRIYTGDLNLVVGNWKRKAGDPTLNPCADIDHKDSFMPFKFRVYTADLNIIIANWKKKAADLPGDCPRPE